MGKWKNEKDGKIYVVESKSFVFPNNLSMCHWKKRRERKRPLTNRKISFYDTDVNVIIDKKKTQYQKKKKNKTRCLSCVGSSLFF